MELWGLLGAASSVETEQDDNQGEDVEHRNEGDRSSQSGKELSLHVRVHDLDLSSTLFGSAGRAG